MDYPNVPLMSPWSGREEHFSTIGEAWRARNHLLILFHQVRERSWAVCKLVRYERSLGSLATRLQESTDFFETALLVAHLDGYIAFEPVVVGTAMQRVMPYRHHVDEQIRRLLHDHADPVVDDLLAWGIAREKRQQEAMLADILSFHAEHPGDAAYDPYWKGAPGGRRGEFLQFRSGDAQIGAADGEFSLPHERPRHLVHLEAFSMADRLVSNEEWLEFMHDGGYERAQFWSEPGWSLVCQERWCAPLHWQVVGLSWLHMTLGGTRELAMDEAVRHISYFEAEAYARWAGARLPTEQEWERAAPGLEQVNGDVWQWTSSSYRAYIGGDEAIPYLFQDGSSADSPVVLRGGSSITAPGTTRLSYRNFAQPRVRTMFTGLRLARGVSSCGAAGRNATGEVG